MSQQAILKAIPHRPPFLLLDEIVEQEEGRIVCRKHFAGDEFWYVGHYPEYPLTPGVLLCEACMQAGGVLLAQEWDGSTEMVPVATRMNNVRFKRMVRPGDTILIEVNLTERLKNAFYMTGTVKVDDKIAVRLDFACSVTAKNK